MFRLLPALTIAACLVHGPLLSADEDWPQFRGPQGNGCSNATGLPVHWSSSEQIAWKTPIPGEGWSSPVVADGRIYVSAAVSASGDHQLMLGLYGLDQATGEVEWFTEIFREDTESSATIHTKNSHASPTPIVAGGKVYVHFGHQGTACLTTDGQIVWKTQELSYTPVHGNGGSPVLLDGLLIFSVDGQADRYVVALDARNGTVVWKQPRDVAADRAFSFCTPTVIDVDGQQQVISAGSNVVSAHAPRTGKVLWYVRYTGYSVVPKPIYHDGLLLMSTGFDSPEVLAIRPAGAHGDATQEHIAWRASRSAPNTPSLLAVDDLLYMVSDGGVASCLELQTGKTVWRQRLGGKFSASPVYADGKIYFQNESGVGYVIRAGREYELLAKNDLGERTLASYAVADHALYIRTAEHLYCVRGSH